MGNYTLQKYKGTATRHTCPNCGDRRSFTYYVDESGTPCTRLSAGATTKAVAGIITLQRSISMTTPNAVLPTVSLLTGKSRNRSPYRNHGKQP